MISPTNVTASATLTCYPQGVPNIYTYLKWQLVWPGYGVVKEWEGSEILQLTDLNYEYSGEYSCFASNNVKNKTGASVMKGHVLMTVTCKCYCLFFHV